MGKLIIDGNKVYEIDEECLEKKRHKEQEERKREWEQKWERKGTRGISRNNFL